MEFDEEHKTSRVVVETPQARREVVHTETMRGEERRGISTGAVAAIVVAAVALTAIAFMFLINRNGEPNQPLSATPTLAPPAAPQTTVVQQPVAVPPTTIIQQAPPPTQAPIVLPPASAPATTPPIDDGTLQSNISNAMMNDSELAASDIQVTVLNAEATLAGNVNTLELKRRAERVAHAVKGVKKVDNKISVIGQEDEGTTTKTLP